MKQKRISAFFFALFLLIATYPVSAEKISLKFSFSTNSIGDGDINTWLNSFNSLWQDWKKEKGGSLEGQFDPISYGSNMEFELRIPIISGFAINLGIKTQLFSEKEGTVLYQNEAKNQSDEQAIFNQVKALPLKIGLSYSYSIPALSNLSVFGSIGRHIIFVRYSTKEIYSQFFTPAGIDISGGIEKENNFRSEALGFYASFGAEFDLLKFVAFVLEVEKTWAKIDGFKGSHSLKTWQRGIPLKDSYNEEIDSGKASLYFYESDQWNLNQFYSVLSGQIEKPESTFIRNLRQAELNFSGISLKIGLRFKF
ncbi:hypothetical protein ACFLRM_00725 [Acidobacteriota bacterium]